MQIAVTERLLLRTWTLSDADVAASSRLWTDPEIMSQIVGGVLPDEPAARASLERAIARQKSDGIQLWAVEELSSHEVVGACGFSPFGPGPVYELTFMLARPSWGRGYATEAGAAAIEYAFEHLGAAKLVAGTLGEHPASARVLVKLGFTYCGTIVWPDNNKEDPYYELLPGGRN
jgi:RimJ/RimL family protein N-acetyltransferase